MWQIMDLINAHKKVMVSAEDALPGRDSYPYELAREHVVLSTDMLGADAPGDAEEIILAGGCFWGIERVAWQIDGVHSTAAGYAGGHTPHPTYEEVCSARTGHTEAVIVRYTGGDATLKRILEQFWQQHDPTTENRQGNDVGTEYRSAIYWTNPAQEQTVRASLTIYQQALTAAGAGRITTELSALTDTGAGEFFYAEPVHQQYLAKNPLGYCNHGFNGVACALA
ncbi:peptide-methionine (S)-S-oxide reductase MsrA [Helcobacillus massiliensis]|uniref:peptide-methionine (S)-S-oxide reductase MsrA n=1 Tax=Helcobacillus massiliensis TaxID=521392 RepID=UPI002557BB26|nr:peptide-methionine (S)-S-oxide reductase MsrA [Helcobacillus massiliensis]MDK7741449.1 peptide-methionine (S)-S-oxide reductase MsrA [Helcobacillus massiliensis]WOO92429.1 peptide-methionine (S)-S-oxide reductase MsrA [Helcobacillus massiliensis]